MEILLATEIQLLRAATAGAAISFTLMAAALGVWSMLRPREEGFRNRLERIWRSLESTVWLRLPERCISWLLGVGDRDMLFAIFFIGYFYLACAVCITTPVMTFYAWGRVAGSIFAIVSAALAYVLWLFRTERIQLGPGALAMLIPLAFVAATVTIAGAIAGTTVLVGSTLPRALMLSVALIPTYFWLLIPAVLCGLYFDRSLSILASLSLGVTVGFPVTVLALYLGSIARPDEAIPVTFQLLAVNTVCDGATLAATIWLLKWALVRPLTRLPTAVVVDLSFAAALACLSLHGSLLGSTYQLAPEQTLETLLTLNPRAQGFSIGPEFLVMHTSFLPTAAYLLVISLAWFCKALLLPVRWLLGTGRAHQNPVALAISVVSLVAAIMSLIERLLAAFA